MIYGVGTGRCGTKSLAKSLGGLHEPKPWFTDEPKKWYLSGTYNFPLNRMIIERSQLRVPVVVDFKQAYMMGLILRLDITAKFIWVIRDPVSCIRSMMKGKWYAQDEPNILEPWSGWDEGQSPLSKCIWYYRTVNEHIYKYKRWVKLVYFTEDLPEWENKYPADITYEFTEEELTRIHDGCDSIYKKAREL